MIGRTMVRCSVGIYLPPFFFGVADFLAAFFAAGFFVFALASTFAGFFAFGAADFLALTFAAGAAGRLAAERVDRSDVVGSSSGTASSCSPSASDSISTT